MLRTRQRCWRSPAGKEEIDVRKHRVLYLAVPMSLAMSLFTAGGSAGTGALAAGSGVGIVPQKLQSDWSYANSFTKQKVTNVFATTQQTSCYRPEDPYPGNLAPLDGYSGMTACDQHDGGPASTTGEDTGSTPYLSQLGSNTGYPAATPMVVKDHSESDIRVDPTNPKHLIASSKWAVSAEGYNHLLGFFESWDGGVTWPVQGHIPGYEGWTDNTDPVGAFDSYGNYYALILPYEFYYNADGSHNYQTSQNKEPNPSVPAEAITIAVRKEHMTAAGATADDWSTNGNHAMDIVAPYPVKGREPDKQWITIDTNPGSQHFNRIYAMWTVFDSFSAVPWMSFADAKSDGTHTPWSTPQVLPTAGSNPQGDTYLLPHVDGNGNVYTTVTNFEPKQGFCCTSILLDRSTDGGLTWQSVSTVISDVVAPPLVYPNTNFRDGIEDTFAVGPGLPNGTYPLYVSWEDHSTGFGNLIISASYDGGQTWSAPFQVNDNVNPVDAVQPNLTAAADGTVSVAFYDRRLPCPAAGSSEAAGAGLALDTSNANYSGSLPPYGATNYCINSSVQFYTAGLAPIGHNIRISQHTWDPQLNSLKASSVNATEGFIGDYYGNITSGSIDYTTSVSTFNDATNSNPNHYQQQVVATLAVP
jgi:hypothetical protein